jgi:hypothetical protein
MTPETTTGFIPRTIYDTTIRTTSGTTHGAILRAGASIPELQA